MKKHPKLKFITKISILTALATVLSLVEFPLPFFPEFYKIDFSSAVIMTGSFALGPLSGIIMSILKNLIKLLIVGTKTAFVGEFTDVLVTIVYIFPAAAIYHHSKSLKNAVIGMCCGVLTMTVCASILNYYVLIPTYAKLLGMPLDSIVAIGAQVNSKITSLRTLIVWGTLPFNLFKGVVCSLITFLLYKRVSKILHL